MSIFRGWLLGGVMSCFISLLAVSAHAADATIEVGTIVAEKHEHGGKGAPLIFIPGLAGGAWSWDDMVRRFAPDHAVYALTLAGFSGRAPARAPIIDKVVADIARLIGEQGLQRPVLVGHSLGAFIAFRVGIEHPDLVGGVIAVDGFPVFSPLAEVDATERRAAAERLVNGLVRGKSTQEFQAALASFLAARMNDPQKAMAMAERAGRSDPDSVAHYIMEMLPNDLRPDLARMKAPVLALVATDSYKKGLPDSEVRGFYRRMLANAPRAAVVLIHNARHFVYVDQPEAVGVAIEGFLAGRESGSR